MISMGRVGYSFKEILFFSYIISLSFFQKSFFKWAILACFSIYFRPFKHTIQVFATNECEKMSIHWCWESNARPLEHESPPITTRPGLPPYSKRFFCMQTKVLHCLTYLRASTTYFPFSKNRLIHCSVNLVIRTKTT